MASHASQPPRSSDRRDQVHINVQHDRASSPSTSRLPTLAPTRTAAPPTLPSLGFRSMSRSPAAHSRTLSSSSATSQPPRSSVARWRALIETQVAQIQREGLRKGLLGKTRFRGGVGGVEAALKNGMKGFAKLWITEADPPAKEHLHGDSDLPPSSTLTKKPATALGLSQLGTLLVVALFFLGLRELLSASSPSSPARKRLTASDIYRRSPFAVLRALSPPPSKYATALPGYDRLWKASSRANPADLDAYSASLSDEGDTTAVILHWKRLDNVKVILAHLCQYTMFDSVLVWNNNPDVVLTREMFSSSLCPPHKLRIYNSPRNLFFFARYLACATHSTTPFCYFQDDDWIVQPVRALYAQFKRDPEGPVVVSADRDMASLYGLEWCFFNAPSHTCLSWSGTGAFTSRTHVERFLATVTYLGYTREELAHADTSFTTFLNQPPYVIESASAQLPHENGYSDDGKGVERNNVFIQKGISRLSHFLHADFAPSASFPAAPLSIDTSPYRSPLSPPLPPHPYAHHVRAACLSTPISSRSSPSHTAGLVDPQCLFLTNIPLLPPPDAVPYPGPAGAGNLSRWEEHLGHTASGRAKEGEVWGAEENWKAAWSYDKAVDGDATTAFRSPDVAHEGDYVGLALLAPLDAAWVPKVLLSFVLEDAAQLLKFAAVEVSADGYRWTRPIPAASSPSTAFICTTTWLSSARPDLSFPDSRLVSPTAQRVHRAEALFEQSSSRLSRWWRRRRRRSERLKECRVELSSRLPADEPAMGGWQRSPEGEAEAGTGQGWRFVRLVLKGDAGEVGWGLYEMWLASGDGR